VTAIYQLFADETNTAASSTDFFLYGGLAIPPASAHSLHRDIERVRRDHGFSASDSLKFNRSGKHPVAAEQYTAAKRAVVGACRKHGAVFFAAACLHEVARHQSLRETTWRQANTVLSRFNSYLTEVGGHGIVMLDRLERAAAPFEYVQDKFQRGLTFPDGTERRLERVLGLGLTCDGASHFSSACDIVLGAFRYVINARSLRPATEKMLCEAYALFWKNGHGTVTDRGLVLSPRTPQLPYRGKYSELRQRLNRVLAGSVASRRDALGWTQERLALAANVTRPTVSHIETGRHMSSLSVVADALTREEDRREKRRERAAVAAA